MKSPNTFLESPRLRLCVPSEEDCGIWSHWFNDAEITRYLDQGMFPNSVQMQQEFLRQSRESGRLILLVRSKSENDLLGVISASDIDLQKRSAQVSYVIPRGLTLERNVALEALLRLVVHLIDTIGVDRIWAGHVIPGLVSWASKTMCIGFKPEGVFVGAFCKGCRREDVLRMSLLAEEFENAYRSKVDLFLKKGGGIDQLLTSRRHHEQRLLSFVECMASFRNQ